MGNQIEILSTIQELVEANQLKPAKELLSDYRNLFPHQVEAISIQVVIALMEGDLFTAEAILQEGLQLDPDNFELLFNKAYLLECKEDWTAAYNLYERLETYAILKYQEQLVLAKQRVADAIAIKRSNETKPKLKLAVFVKPQMDSFLGDILTLLETEYEVCKCQPQTVQEIDDKMDWADICWFEWCDELISYGSKLELAKNKKIICRLHSYEAFAGYPANVCWENVDKVIFVADHIRRFVLENTPSLLKEKTIIIPNGIDVSKFKYKNNKPGFNIAYVGYINYKKGPMLLLHTFKAIHDLDSRYKLYIAGTFQDARDVLYFKQMVEEMNLKDSIIYTGWQENLDVWLEDKNYILCTSILESQNISVMQAMAKGIKPLIHNFVGAKGIYFSQYVWSTIEQCLTMLTETNYNSQEYNKFVTEQYSLNKQLHLTKKVIAEIESSVRKATIPVSKAVFDYDAYWNQRLNAKFDIEGVGYIGLGKTYNKQLYEIRINILDYIIKNLFSEGLKHKKVLELGPGIGIFTQLFHSLKVKYEAIDITAKSVTELRKRYRNYRFTQGDICNPELYCENTYDLIFAADVLLHLTDEDKYQIAMKNISQGLKEQGYAILYDPITVINTKSQSPHVCIRDVEYIREICIKNGLMIAGLIPCSFFMNFPFDQNLNATGIKTATIFSTIQQIFGTTELTEKEKETLARWLTTEEKRYLLQHGFGFSQKALVLKKVNNQSEPNLSIKNIWKLNDVIKEQASLDNKISLMCDKYNNVAQLHKLVEDLETSTELVINEVQATESQQPLVTVGILNYNGLQYLHTCLESFIRQSYKNIEILVIDDCSTDGSLEIIREYEQRYSCIKGVYHSENSGGAARGIQDIISMAKGKYFQWISYDDFVEPDAITVFVDFLEKNIQYDYVFSDYNIVDDNNCKYNEWKYEVVSAYQAVQQIFMRISGLVPMNGLYKASFFREKNISWLLYKNNDYSSDTLNYLQFVKFGWQYAKIEKGLINYRIHGNNLSHNIQRRITSSKTILDYIVENFEESVYWPNIDWNNAINRTQLKSYILAKIYYEHAVYHMDITKLPSYLQNNVAISNNLKEYCFDFIIEGMKYLKAGLTIGNTAEFNELLKKYYNLYPELKEKLK